MLKTAAEIMGELGGRVRDRRRRLHLTQAEAAARAGVAYGTWRRLETRGRASMEDFVRAAIALRAEDDLDALFAPPAAASLDELLQAETGGRRR